MFVEERRPILGFSQFHRGSVIDIPDGAHLTLFARRGSKFVPLDSIPGSQRPYGKAFKHNGLTGLEIEWDLPFRPTAEIREVVLGYVADNGYEGPTDQFNRLMQLLS